MKPKTILTLLLVAVVLSAQAGDKDSTRLAFTYLDRELSLISDLNNIQYISFVCKDKRAKGKKFLFLIEEYKNGIKLPADSTGLLCEEVIYPMEVNGKTVNYRVSPCHGKMFMENDTSFTVSLAGKLEADTFKLIIAYPSTRVTKKLIGDSEYSLRTISCDANDQVTIPFSKITPVFAYTPPFNTGSGLGHYCILGTSQCDNWYQEFGIKHYYIISLLIE